MFFADPNMQHSEGSLTELALQARDAVVSRKISPELVYAVLVRPVFEMRQFIADELRNAGRAEQLAAKGWLERAERDTARVVPLASLEAVVLPQLTNDVENW